MNIAMPLDRCLHVSVGVDDEALRADEDHGEADRRNRARQRQPDQAADHGRGAVADQAEQRAGHQAAAAARALGEAAEQRLRQRHHDQEGDHRQADHEFGGKSRDRLGQDRI